ncbi:hypothetical protein ACU8KH_01601 [Lachancea thermotolerans]
MEILCRKKNQISRVKFFSSLSAMLTNISKFSPFINSKFYAAVRAFFSLSQVRDSDRYGQFRCRGHNIVKEHSFYNYNSLFQTA